MAGEHSFKRKPGNQNGETIVETLTAILIAALSCTILMTAVTAAVSINRNASEAQEKFEAELLEAEMQNGTEEKEVLIKIKQNTSGSSTESTIAVNAFFTGGEGKLTSYRIKEEGD